MFKLLRRIEWASEFVAPGEQAERVRVWREGKYTSAAVVLFGVRHLFSYRHAAR